MTQATDARLKAADALLTARGAICVQISPALRGSVAILHEKTPDRPAPPASITKLLTAVTVLRILERKNLSLSDELTVEANDDAEGSGRNLQAGDRLSIADALANLLLASSNSCANALARAFGAMLPKAAAPAPTARFVAEMNVVAASLGMERSHFHNPHGLGARGQLSTARDLSYLVTACLDLPGITRVWGERRHVLTIEGPNARLLTIPSIFRASTRQACPDFAIPQYRGGKSGSLWPSVFNLAAVSERADGALLVTVTLGSPTVADRFRDYQALVAIGNAAPALAAAAEPPPT